MAGAGRNEEDTMRLITMKELATRTETDLADLFTELSAAVVRTDRETPERANGLGSLENIARARASRACEC